MDADWKDPGPADLMFQTVALGLSFENAREMLTAAREYGYISNNEFEHIIAEYRRVNHG